MSDPSAQNASLEELRAFLGFLRHLWGLLAGLSVFFPLSNILTEAIPLRAYGSEDGVFDQLSPFLITTLATVVTLFVILSTFSTRSSMAVPRGRRTARRRAGFSFAISLLSLLAYLVIHQVYREYAWQPWGWGSGDPRKLIAEVPLLISYVLFFSMLTRAFMLLGMLEFFRSGEGRGGPMA